MIFKFEYLNQFKGLGFNFFKEKNFPKFCLNKIKQKVDILSINIDNSKNVDDESNRVCLIDARNNQVYFGAPALAVVTSDA